MKITTKSLYSKDRQVYFCNRITMKNSYSNDLLIHQLFETQVSRTPNAIALVSNDQHLTYDQLNARSNQLAHQLLSYGVGAEVKVGLCLDRSTEMIEGILAILKAGGAYVPIDPNNPDKRINYILQDSQVAVIVTKTKLLDVQKIGETDHCIYLDKDWPIIQKNLTSNPILTISANSVAYVIYTSGTTGKPKGTLVEHGNIPRLFFSSDIHFLFYSDDTWCFFHSFAFDFSVWELWGALIYGGKVIIVPYSTSRNSEKFCQLVYEQQVTVLNQTPTAFSQFIIADQSLNYSISDLKLRYIIFGGEALNRQSLLPWFDRHGDDRIRLINMYGITESTVHTTYCPVNYSNSQASVGSIGKPLEDLQCYILDDQLTIQPVGEPGELYISGGGIVRGYHNRPDLTAERFLPNPFSQLPGDRVYKTGDLVCSLTNGDLEYQGRIDQQVKIRGFRIELSEIENVLKEQSNIIEAVVLANHRTSNNKQSDARMLVAYLVPSQIVQQNISISMLRKQLQTVLPDYMVPNQFLFIDAIPLNSSGKINRQALTELSNSHLSDIKLESRITSQTITEAYLVYSIAEVFEIDIQNISINSSFLTLGGDSLLAASLLHPISKDMGVDLSIVDIINADSIQSLAATIDTIKNAGFDSTRVNSEETIELATVAKNNPIPASFAQQRLWFSHQLDNRIYNEPLYLQVNGPLNIAALEYAIHATIQRQKIFQTVFQSKEQSNSDTTYQLIQPHRRIAIPIIQIDDSKTAFDYIENHTAHVFSLRTGPLINVCVLRLSLTKHTLMLIMHHIICDGWSMKVLGDQLSEFYSTYINNDQDQLIQLKKPLRIQYADFSQWQHLHITDTRLKTLLGYWLEKLKEAPSLLELPADRIRPARQSYSGSQYYFDIPPDLTLRLKAVSQRYKTTLFMTLLTGFTGLLHRYTGANDICIGIPSANRQQTDLKDIIGFFVNTLVLRSQINSNLEIAEYIRQTKNNALDAYSHQELPFECLVDALNPERNLSYSPLYQVVFTLQDGSDKTFKLRNLTISALNVDTHKSKFDLTVFINESGNGLKATLEYNTDLFEPRTIAQLSQHYCTFLDKMTQQPTAKIVDLQFLSSAEQQEILFDWNSTTTPYAKNLCVHQLFENQVRNIPDKIAVSLDDLQLTYSTLNQLSNTLAHDLITLGIKTETRIGLITNRSIATIIGTLAILKAGGTYVPIDLGYPEQRIQYQIDDSNLVMLLGDSQLKNKKVDRLLIKYIGIDEKKQARKTEHVANPTIKLHPLNLCYIIYTSGSTGQPKGVAIPHRAVNRLVNNNRIIDVTSQKRFLQVAPFSFDAATFELWGALLNGATCVLFNDLIPSAESLSLNTNKYCIDTLWLTTALFNTIIDHDPSIVKNLKNVFIGGETVSTAHIVNTYKHCYKTTIINCYGPTENTTFSTTHKISKDTKASSSIPIGRPISNSTAYIIDESFNNTPVRVTGELLLGKDGLARGYIENPKLTAEKFVPNPFSQEPGERLYRSGDLARYLENGDIEYIGRTDFQVKIRGFRIEIGEIESALMALTVIDEAIVIAENSPHDNKQKYLIAYIVPDSDNPLAENDLKSALGSKLPDYMIPSHFVFLKELPLTNNGKVDRKYLPKPDIETLQAVSFVKPTTETEKSLAIIWSKLLKFPADKISLYSDFFALGGHSLLATRLISNIKSEFNITLEIQTLFTTKTLIETAKAIDDISNTKDLIRQLERPRTDNLSIEKEKFIP